MMRYLQLPIQVDLDRLVLLSIRFLFNTLPDNVSHP